MSRFSEISEKVVKLDGSSHANERGIAPLMDELSMHDYDCVVACGSGSLHDITRYCAHERTIDFVSFPTAPSVDGFVSIGRGNDLRRTQGVV